MFSALKALVSPSTPVATFSSFIMMARSRLFDGVEWPPGASLGASGCRFQQTTKFCPHQSGELMTALTVSF